MATREQLDLVKRVILETRRNTIVWKEEEGKLSALAILDYIGSQRKIKVVLLKKEEEPHYKMVLNFVENSARDLFGVNCSEYKELGRFGSYMFGVGL